MGLFFNMSEQLRTSDSVAVSDENRCLHERKRRQIGQARVFFCGVDVVGLCDGNNREDEVGVVCEGQIRGGSSNVRNMTCGRDDECFGDNAHKAHCNVSF